MWGIIKESLLAGNTKLILVLLTGRTFQFWIHETTLRISSQGTTKEENVWFRTVDNKMTIMDESHSKTLNMDRDNCGKM